MLNVIGKIALAFAILLALGLEIKEHNTRTAAPPPPCAPGYPDYPGCLPK